MRRNFSSSYWHGNSGSAKNWRTGIDASLSWSASGYGTPGDRRHGLCARRRPTAGRRPSGRCPTPSRCPTSPEHRPRSGTPRPRQNLCGSTSTARPRRAPIRVRSEGRFTGPERSPTTSYDWCNSTVQRVPAPDRLAQRGSPPCTS